MADNEKLDNQRLKNFKNKGRDLEVMCFHSRWEVSFLSFALFCCFGFRCDVVCNFQDLELCSQLKPGHG